MARDERKITTNRLKRLWMGRTVLLVFLLFAFLTIAAVVHKIRLEARRVGCAIQLKCIHSAFCAYMNDYEENLPTADSWNDLLITDYDMDFSVFHCPGSNSSGKTSDYALNINLYGNERSAAPDTVLLFECVPGNNRVGGPEIFNDKNHGNKGGNYNTLGICEGKLILYDKIQTLKWYP
jgi:hypothetical protein